MFKQILFVSVIGLVLIAYLEIDVTEQYEQFSEIRNSALNEVIDPLVIEVLHGTANLELEKTIEEYLEYFKEEST